MSELLSKSELLTISNLNRCRLVIRELMAQHRINATELARRIQLPQPTVHRLLVGKTVDPKLSTLTLLADYFSVSIDQLLGNVPLTDEQVKQRVRIRSVPIISWQEAIQAKKLLSTITDNNCMQWFVVDIQASPFAFSLITKPSMEPRFPVGSLLAVDPEVVPQDGDLVVVHYQNTSEATLRELMLDGPKQQLRSIMVNEMNFDTLNDEIMIIGVVIQMRFSYK